MLISHKWLCSFFEVSDLKDKTVYDLANILTFQGIEVASIKYLGDAFKGVVVGEVKDCQKHPDADKLSLCSVFDGKDVFQVVCGANNVRAGIKIAFAKVDAVLPSDFVIKKAKIRGVESFGMICSEKELGLADKSEGIWILPEDAKLGEDLIKFCDMDDYILEIEITPNRGDCLSALGIAREISAGLDCPIQMPDTNIKDVLNRGEKINLEVWNKELCSSYKFAILNNFEMKSSETPVWMKTMLLKSGIRPINLPVDITNYVLLETGHPMHVFDYDKLSKNTIIVRDAKNNEKVLALDGKEYKLTETDLVIADAERPIAIAGIMGAETSGVDENTKIIVFESAVFDPANIRKTSKNLALSSDSSYRFERGTSEQMSEIAINRACNLLAEICPSAMILQKEEVATKDKKVNKIGLRVSNVSKMVGKQYSIEGIVELLNRLGFISKRIMEDVLEMEVPFYRHDIQLEIDLIEEIIRIDVYEKIAAKPMKIVPFNDENQDGKWGKIWAVKNFFKGLSFHEALNYSFLSQEKVEILGNIQDCLQIMNPLSKEEEFLNISRLPRVIENVVGSFNRGEESIKMFELGKSFSNTTNLSEDLENNEKYKLAIVCVGNDDNLSWQQKTKKMDFYYLKGVLETFLSNFYSDEYVLAASSNDFLDIAESADIMKNGKKMGFIGKLNKKVLKSFDMKQAVYVAEIDFEFNFEDSKKYNKFSSYPAVSRDFSLIVSKSVKYQEVKDMIIKSGGELLKAVNIFDIYEGEQIDKSSKNIAIRLVFQSDKKTLEEKTINFLLDKILGELDKSLGVKLRIV